MSKRVVCRAILKSGQKVKVALKIPSKAKTIRQMQELVQAALTNMELQSGNRGSITWGKTIIDLNDCAVLSFSKI